MANGMRRTDQCAQTTSRFESLSISWQRWHETMGWIRRDCRLSDQYRNSFGPSVGGSLKKIEKHESAQPAEQNPLMDRSKNLFLRRKVASPSTTAGFLNCSRSSNVLITNGSIFAMTFECSILSNCLSKRSGGTVFLATNARRAAERFPSNQTSLKSLRLNS
jgi:hypothetical protein